MADAIATVRQFLDSLDASSLEESLQNLAAAVTDDFVWQNSGFPTCEGRDAGVAFFRGFAAPMGLTGIRVEVLAMAAHGDAVVTERIDHFVGADGQVVASLPLAGTLEVSGDKVKAWRDYFDPRPLLG
jgi:limonene-1,2-epoxide hydrolase